MYTESNGLGSDPKPVYYTSLAEMAQAQRENEADWEAYWLSESLKRAKVRAPPIAVRTTPTPVRTTSTPAVRTTPKAAKHQAKPAKTIADALAEVDIPELVIELAEYLPCAHK